MQNEPVCETDVITEAPTRAIIFYFVLEIRNIFVLQNTILKTMIPSPVDQKFPSKVVRKWGISTKLVDTSNARLMKSQCRHNTSSKDKLRKGSFQTRSKLKSCFIAISIA